MKTGSMMTAGAIAFAGFALWYVTRKPGGQVAAQPGQAVRDTGLQAWHDLLDAQRAEIEGTSYALSAEQFRNLLRKS